jgi:hypothetical protein
MKLPIQSVILALLLAFVGSHEGNAQSTQPQPRQNPNPTNDPDVARGFRDQQEQYYSNRNNQPSDQQLHNSSQDYSGDNHYNVNQSQQH